MQSSRAILRLMLALVVLGGAYAGLATFLSHHLPSRTTVNRIAVGGMSPAEATVTLKRVLASRASQPIHLETASRTVDIEPSTAGIEVDLEATLSDLSGFTLDPLKMWEHLTGGEDQPLKVRVDRARLTAAVTEAARAVDSPVVEGSITFTGGKATIVPSAVGRAVNVAETTDEIASRWPEQQGVQSVMTITQPKVAPGEIDRAATEFATPAMSGPVQLQADGTTVTLQPVDYAPALSLVPDGTGVLRPIVDEAKLLAAIRASDPSIERSPVDATVRLVSGAPQVVPAVVGSAIAPLTASPSFLAALTSPTRTALIPMVSTAPTLTTEMVQAWGIKEPISTFTTHFPFNPPRTNNMTIAAAALNGTIVRSGDQFSLNAILGERTPAKGYLKAPVIYAGRLEKAYGGGVSQVSTTVFNAAFFAGVRIEDHTTHSFYISRYPEGREATLSWPDVDQKWTNDSGSGILISSSLTGSDLTVTFFGTKAWEIEAVKGPRRNMVPPKIILDGLPGCVPQAPTPGFDVTVTRIFKRDGARVKSSQFNTHYIPEDNVSCTSPS
jgi:vancomycin resistance protein YoaR